MAFAFDVVVVALAVIVEDVVVDEECFPLGTRVVGVEHDDDDNTTDGLLR